MDKEISEKINFLKDASKKLHDEFKEYYKLPKDYKEEFSEMTKILSDFLPKLEDPILFEIDDILFPGQEYKGNENSKYPAQNLIDIPNISIYFRAYRCSLDCDNDVFTDNTVLRFIKHFNVDTHHLRIALQFLLNSKNEKNVCRALKIWKIILEGESKERFLDRELYCKLLSFKEIAEAKDPEYKRISKFISQLVEECCNLVGEDNRYIFPEKGQSNKKAIIQGLHCLISNDFLPNYYLEFFYKTFSSIPEDNVEEREEYLKCILRAITSCPMRLGVDTAITIIVDHLLGNIRGALSHSMSIEMVLIDAKYGRNIKPYLEEVDFVVDPSEFYADEYYDENDENDYTFEKFFYYDKVMKNLHLLTILYTAFAECNNLCEGEFREDYTKTFREDNDLRKNVAYYLENNELDVPWYVKKTMMMCPFLLFPLEHKDLVIYLIKLQREDEDVPMISEELRKKVPELKAFELNMRRKDLSRYDKR